jgi:hypothetical protein
MNGKSTEAAVEDARRYLLLLLEEVWLSDAQSAEINRGIEAIAYLTELDEPLASVCAAPQW